MICKFSFYKIFWLCLMPILLAGCRKEPLQITQITINPDPIVGQVVTMTVEFISTQDESDVGLKIYNYRSDGNQVNLLSSDTWVGKLSANQKHTFDIEVCVMQEGEWPVLIEVFSKGADGKLSNIDSETVHFKSMLESGQLIREGDYSFDQNEYARRPTSRPFTVSDECSVEK